jgi:phenylalanyl-tRNA synthetase beta chain
MILTREWLNDIIDINDISTDEMCATFNSIGLEVDSVTKIRIPAKVVIGYVKNCEKHPDADKLSVCEVDVGEKNGGTVQIVCGAKNVRADIYVAVSTIGATLKDKEGNDFKIKKSKLRGVESYGMICSSNELGLPKINDGIMILDNSIGKLEIGKELSKYKTLNDDIIEIELTANRGDCLSIYGIAREISAFYRKKIKDFEKVEYCDERLGIGKFLNVDHSSETQSSLVYKVANIEDLNFPLSYQLRINTLNKTYDCELRKALEYITHTTGILIDCFIKSQFEVKKDQVDLKVKKDENGFDCVYGKEKLSIIGVNSNTSTEEDEDIILQMSYINPEMIAQKVHETKIKTEEVYYRSSRGSEPNIEQGSDFVEYLLTKLGVKFYNGSENFIEDIQNRSLDLNLVKVNSFIGQNISVTKIEEILRWLRFSVKNAGKDLFNLEIPNFRHDIVNFADVVEEIVRIVGIDNIEPKPLAQLESSKENNVSNDIKNRNNIRTRSVANGFFETITYVFSSRENLEKFGFDVVSEEKDILNPISSELNSFRTTLLLNLVEAVSKNRALGYKRIPLFEIGSVFDKDRNESTKMAFVYSGDVAEEDVSNHGKPKDMDFFAFAKKISTVLGEFSLKELTEVDNAFIHPYQSAQIIKNYQGKEVTIGVLSKLHPSVAKEFDISSETFFAQIDFNSLEFNKIEAVEISKFQKSIKDLSFVVPKNLEFQKIRDEIDALKIDTLQSYHLVDIYSDEKMEESESLTIRFTLQSMEKTLEDNDMNMVLDNIIDRLKTKFGISLR